MVFKRLQNLMLSCLAILVSANAMWAVDPAALVTVVEPRCEYRTAPLGIDTQEPRLGWRIDTTRRSWAQKTYRVLVASTMALLQAETGDLWDSGEVTSSASQQIIYRGKTLNSAQTFFWQVRVTGKDDSRSE
jgi:alpha-L-rhamnosidase